MLKSEKLAMDAKYPSKLIKVAHKYYKIKKIKTIAIKIEKIEEIINEKEHFH